jgi:hypothetical protein
MDRTTLSQTFSLASNPSLLYHPTTRWPHRRTPTTNCEHFWRQTPPYGSRSNKFPTPQSPSTATRLPESLDRTFQPPYASKCSSLSTICHTQAPKQRRNSSHSVLCGRHMERLPHLVTGLSGLPTLQSLPPHSYSCGRIYSSNRTL